MELTQQQISNDWGAALSELQKQAATELRQMPVVPRSLRFRVDVEKDGDVVRLVGNWYFDNSWIEEPLEE
jgi:hypothetical protein